jgi:plastocyanin
MKESGWYSTAVNIKITAEDSQSGVKEIHYVLDGTEFVVPGDTAEFTVTGSGEHTLSYWAVDTMGNAGAPQTVMPFKIDSGAKPTVDITAPEPGIYIFGKKLLSSTNTFIIGAFTVEADAEDEDSGIYKVAFYLDDELLGEDTEAPFSQYVSVRHMGAGTIKVVAEDFAQNIAEDELDLKYYKFF